MRLHGPITINGKEYKAGEEAPMGVLYGFFLVHMGIFGLSGFFMAYGTDDIDLSFLYMHGGIAIVVSALVGYLVAHVSTEQTLFARAGITLMALIVGMAIVGFVDWFLSDGIGAVEEADYIPLDDAALQETVTAWEGR